jgi:DNA-binding response OmpR family regulator
MSSHAPSGRLVVLVAEDNRELRQSLCDWLVLHNIVALAAENGLRAIETLQRERVDLLLTDLVMPEREGLETITWARTHQPFLKIFAMSGSGSLINTPIYLQMAQKLGADAILYKPFDLDELKGLIQYHFKAARIGLAAGATSSGTSDIARWH